MFPTLQWKEAWPSVLVLRRLAVVTNIHNNDDEASTQQALAVYQASGRISLSPHRPVIRVRVSSLGGSSPSHMVRKGHIQDSGPKSVLLQVLNH